MKSASGKILNVDRNNNFNLIRLLLAVLVMLSHAPELLDGNRGREILTQKFGTLSFGEFAVTGFFILSGFLIVHSWEQHPRLVEFLRNRVLRIYPAFIVASALCVFVFGYFVSLWPNRYYAEIDYRAFVANTLLFHDPQTPSVFYGKPYPVINGVMWTISQEFRCYTLVALLGTLGLVRHRLVWLLAPIPMIVLFHAQVLGPSDQTLRVMPLFASGACFYLYRDHIRYNIFGAAVALIGLYACLHRIQTAHIGMAVFGAYLMFWFAFQQNFLLAQFRKFPDISYGLYLYGWPSLEYLIWYFPLITPWTLFAAGTAAAASFGLLSWILVERPSLQLKTKTRLAPARQTTPCAA